MIMICPVACIQAETKVTDVSMVTEVYEVGVLKQQKKSWNSTGTCKSCDVNVARLRLAVCAMAT